MRYLPFIQRSIARLGFVKAEYAPDLAIFMEEYEGQHPHQIARLFRQNGIQLDGQTKRAHGLRANTAMSNNALNALTQRGLANPKQALDDTLLDASFAYFRWRTAQGANHPNIASYARLLISTHSRSCRGCARLDGREIAPSGIDTLPPDDCDETACGITVRLKVDYVQRLIDERESTTEKFD